MFQITIDDHNYVVQFKHRHIDSGIRTACYIVEEEWTVTDKNYVTREGCKVKHAISASSEAVKARADGRKQSLAKCLFYSKFNKKQKYQIWLTYFAESGYKEPGRQKFFLDYFTTDEEPF